jgi:hypothetical protein
MAQGAMTRLTVIGRSLRGVFSLGLSSGIVPVRAVHQWFHSFLSFFSRGGM